MADLNTNMTLIICRDDGEIDGKGISSANTNLPTGWFKGVSILRSEKSSKKLHGTDSWLDIYIASSDEDLANQSFDWDFETLASKIDLGKYYHDVRRSYINAKGICNVTGNDENDFINGILVENGDYEAAALKAEEKELAHAELASNIKQRITNLSGYHCDFIVGNDGRIFSDDGIYETAEAFVEATLAKQNTLVSKKAQLEVALKEVNKTMPPTIQFTALIEKKKVKIGVSTVYGEPYSLDEVFDFTSGKTIRGRVYDLKRYTDSAKIVIAENIMENAEKFASNEEQIRTFFNSQLIFLEKSKMRLYKSSNGSKETQHQKDIRISIDKKISQMRKWLAIHY